MDDSDGAVAWYDITKHERRGTNRQTLTAPQIRRLLSEAGCVPVERDTLYRPVQHDAPNAAAAEMLRDRHTHRESWETVQRGKLTAVEFCDTTPPTSPLRHANRVRTGHASIVKGRFPTRREAKEKSAPN